MIRVAAGNLEDCTANLACDSFAVSPMPATRGKRLPAEILKVNSSNPEPSLIAYVAERLRSGQVVSVPTDTFYGLAADPVNLRAVDRIYDIKARQRNKALSLMIDSIEMAEQLAADVSKDFELLAERFWPGPLTIIVKASSRLPLRVTANTGNVALRIPAAAIPVSVIKAAGFPITATSANLSGESECTTAQQVHQQLGDRVPLIVDGGTSPRSVASTIVDLSGDDGSWKVIRAGAISVDDVTAILG
jgi:tRNA threonylcarbamoyl adenosine modification protein (Sua5/YciO/YrdC/YwlC family)